MAASDPDRQQEEQPSPTPGQPVRRARPLPSATPLPRAQPLSGEPASPEPPAVSPGQPPPGPVIQALPASQMPTTAPPLILDPAAKQAGARPAPVADGKPPSAIDEPEEEPEEELTTMALRNAPPWLVSAVFHMLLLITLGLLFLPDLVKNQIELESIWAEKIGEQLEFDSFLAGNAEDKVEEPVFTEENLPQVENPFAAPPDMVVLVPDVAMSTSEFDTTQIGMALKGREAGMKRAMLGAYGGNATTEAAVASGLRWLAKMQRKNGSWSLTGPYSNGAGTGENEVAATAMALLAFQGAGNTHKEGDFKSNVTRGWNWLLKEQDGDGNFYHEGPLTHLFYTNGQCAIAICELLGMTEDEKLKEPAERAIGYLLKSQSATGGWRYTPGESGDVSVTGWIVMALQSARMAGIEVPEDSLRRIERFLDRVASESGSRYAYRPREEPRRTMTAEALLCRQYLGWPRNDPRLIDGAEYLTQPENLINYNRDPGVYYWYYATQVAHHMEGEYWKRWNAVMRQAIPEQQVRTGAEAGSWNPGKRNSRAPDGFEWQDRYSVYGGRLYVTCLSIYMLEVYYRHLPIYSNVFHYMHRP